MANSAPELIGPANCETPDFGGQCTDRVADARSPKGTNSRCPLIMLAFLTTVGTAYSAIKLPVRQKGSFSAHLTPRWARRPKRTVREDNLFGGATARFALTPVPSLYSRSGDEPAAPKPRREWTYISDGLAARERASRRRRRRHVADLRHGKRVWVWQAGA